MNISWILMVAMGTKYLLKLFQSDMLLLDSRGMNCIAMQKVAGLLKGGSQ